MSDAFFITALGTPLTEDEQLHHEGFARHFEDQWSNGIHGVLVGGTMGMMQLLADQTYRELVEQSVQIGKGKCEILVGVGDTSFARTRDRVDFVNGFDVDGIVVLTPYLVPFNTDEMLDYFHAIADVSRAPMYLYDLPQLTGVKLDTDFILTVTEHPNIHGVKCSGEPQATRDLIDRVGDSLRVIISQPCLVDVLLQGGINQHLDGIYGLYPAWLGMIAQFGAEGRWDEAAAVQRKLTHVLMVMRRMSVMQAYSEVLNARGIPGCYAPRPFQPLSESDRQTLFDDDVVKEILAEQPVAASA